MITALILFLINVVYIWLKAFQQLNVVHHKLHWVPICSLAMGLCEVIAITKVVQAENYWMFIPIGLGGALGCILAMCTHKRFRERV